MIKIRFNVNGKLIKRHVKKELEAHDVVCDLFREFDDFYALNFYYHNKWVYGATYDSMKKAYELVNKS